jgi:glycosyltransferase involved in cell wall biosynthesis
MLSQFRSIPYRIVRGRLACPREATACGTPVVTSNVTAMPETAGDAALLVNPRSVEQIARAMEQIVGMRSLRQDLRAKGLMRAAQFAWAHTKAKVREVISASAAPVGKTD